MVIYDICTCENGGSSQCFERSEFAKSSWRNPEESFFIQIPSLKLTPTDPENRPGPQRKFHLPIVDFQRVSFREGRFSYVVSIEGDNFP